MVIVSIPSNALITNGGSPSVYILPSTPFESLSPFSSSPQFSDSLLQWQLNLAHITCSLFDHQSGQGIIDTSHTRSVRSFYTPNSPPQRGHFPVKVILKMPSIFSVPYAVSEALGRPVYRSAAFLRGKIGNFTWGPGTAVAKALVQSMLSSIEIGTLLLVDEATGERHVFGQKLGPTKLDNLAAKHDFSKVTNGIPSVRKATSIPRVELVVKHDAFWVRTFLFADMGFAESYMLGEVECADLAGFFQLFLLNREKMGDGTTWTSLISSAVTNLARSTNTLSNALLNISAHYDISNDMFAAFLSPDMTYSCPIWKPTPAGEHGAETLEQAQMTKLHRFIERTKLKSTDHVLEIGTGWGSFAIEAVRTTGCRVTSLTLSKEQKALADQRIAKAGFSDRIEVRLQDYRSLPIPEKPYDKIVSIEMLEAVGQEYLGTYFSCIDKLLKKNGGIAAFQCITMPEGRHEAYSKSEE